MKKTFLLVMVMFFGLAVSAQALPLWEGGYEAESDTIYVVDRSDSDQDTYFASYFGYTGEDYTGYYIGTIQGNTDAYFIEAIQYYAKEAKFELNFNLFEEYTANTDGSKGTIFDENSMSIGPLTVEWDTDGKTGTWTFENYDVIFYAVKGGDEFALYYIPGGANEGEWTTRHLLTQGNTIPAISHFTVAAQVPEPATMLLMGTGLLFLAGFLRRRIYNRK